MQIFFTTSLQTVNEKKNAIEGIIKYLESKGHKVVTRSKIAKKGDKIDVSGIDFIKDDAPVDAESLKTVYLNNQKKILTSDMIICEMSSTSTGIGYDVAQALLANKPVLILYSENTTLTENLIGNSSKRLWTKNYNEKNVTDILDEFTKEARKMIDSKFILIIPPEIEQYLNWASQKKGIRKAEIVRSAIEKHIDTDTDYKKYLSDYDK